MKSLGLPAISMLHIGLLGSMAIFFIFWGTSAALACRPGPNSDIFKSAEENLEKQTFVFLGKLVPATASTTQAPHNSHPGHSRRGQFLMIKQLKGEHVGSDIIFYSATHSCGFFHKEGAVMLIFANKTSEGTLYLSALTPFRTFKSEAEGIKAAEDLLLGLKQK